jgi:hypothetical protein
VLESRNESPAARARLEAASVGARRLHMLGGFYAPNASAAKDESKRCPLCGAQLLKVYFPWTPIGELKALCEGELADVIARVRLRAGPTEGDRVAHASYV